ncbi:HNHc domain-containing protein [Gammaproteobacteria bacterium]
MKTLHERFSTKYKVDSATGCWNWVSNINSAGYGTFYSRQGNIYAHRVSFELHKGIVPRAMLVCHSCDNKKCVNPEHLFVGTYQDNLKDSIKKDRWIRSFTEEQAAEIRRRYQAGGVTQTSIAKEKGVSISTINLIVNNKSYI